MTRCTSVAPLGSQFDSFLFAPIGEEQDGVLDPWEEATELARLPGEMARKRLASLIAALPDRSTAHRDSEKIAARLIALLPSQAGSNGSTRKEQLGVRGGSNSPASTHVVLYVIVMAIILGGQLIVVGRQMPASINGTHAPTPSTDMPQVPLR